MFEEKAGHQIDLQAVKISKMRRRLEMQGYLGLNDEMLAEVGPWARLATGLCMSWTAIGTFLGSAKVLWALMPIAALEAILPWHPFDLIYNHGIRHLLGKAPLPKHRAPRRFACAIATVWLGASGWAFYSGATALGYVLGGLMVLTAAFPTFIDFCVPSFLYGLLFGKPSASQPEKV